MVLCVAVSKPPLSFSPSGWDNEKKIAILHENFQTIKADDNFEEVIVKPPVRKVRSTESQGFIKRSVLVTRGNTGT